MPLNSIFFLSNHGSANILFFKYLPFLVNPIFEFFGILNTLNFLVVLNNLFLIENEASLSSLSYFLGFTILISYN